MNHPTEILYEESFKHMLSNDDEYSAFMKKLDDVEKLFKNDKHGSMIIGCALLKISEISRSLEKSKE